MASAASGTNEDTKPANLLEQWMQNWLTYWHGEGDPHQYRYYRCEGCSSLVTWNMIDRGGCGKCSSNRIRPALLTKIEKARLILMPWTVK